MSNIFATDFIIDMCLSTLWSSCIWVTADEYQTRR